jgi:hypothetical protein
VLVVVSLAAFYGQAQVVEGQMPEPLRK